MPPQGMLMSVAAMWLVAVVIPGPNFFVVARMAALRSRRAALVTVAALGVGCTFWGLAGFFGVHALFAVAPALYAGLRLIGALYLVYVGLRILRGSFRPRAEDTGGNEAGGAFRVGLMTSLSNPKSAMLVGSLFTAVMPPDAPVSVGLATVAEMVAISVGWYATVACVLSAQPVAALFRRTAAWVDRGAGVVFVGFGGRIVAGMLV
jgi:threonine/homoserine/homoserine lactone efflux protein